MDIAHPLHNQLCHSLAHVDLEIDVAEIEQQDFDLASVVCIDDPSPRVDAMLRSESTSRRNSSIRVDR